MSVPETAASPPNNNDNVTPEERQAMINHVVSQCSDLQRLMRAMVETERMLKDDIAEFVCREVVEHQAAAIINEKVVRSQATALANTDYVRWASANQKGEFAHGVTQETLVEQDVASRVAWCELADKMLPPLVVRLPTRLVQRLAGWRRNEQQDVEALVDDFGEYVTLKLEGQVDEPCVVFVNGQCIYDVIPSPQDDVAVQSLLNECSSAASREHVYERWRSWSLGKASTVSIKATLTGSKALADSLRDDGCDFLCCVPLRACLASTPVRAFIVNGKLRALEMLEMHVDVLKHRFGGNRSALFEAAEKVIASNPRVLAHPPFRHCVMTLHIPSEPSAGTPTLVDVQCLTPQISFSQYLSWSDLCGLAKSDDGVVVLKSICHQVASLEPYDATTQLWFPILNAVAVSSCVASSALPCQPLLPPDGHSSVMVLATTVAATAALTYFLTRVLSSQRK